jgi:hypothetical protein
MLLRLLKHQLTIVYTPGKNMLVADTLSRAYLSDKDDTTKEIAEDVEVMVHSLLYDYPASEKKLEELRRETETDPVLQQLSKCIRDSFPLQSELNPELKQYQKIVVDIYELEGLMFLHGKLIVPQTLRREMLKIIHEGHLGIEKCRGLARTCLYWPGINRDIENYISQCSVCKSFSRQQQKESLMPQEIPELPWQRIGADLFQLFGKDYLILVDYYSKYPEICLLNGKTAECVITQMKSVFARHGIPNEVVCDNMPFSSREMKMFADSWSFKITTSSPRYAQSNGLAERNVQTVKLLLKKAEKDGADPYLALLQFRNAPISGLSSHVSPAQLLMSRVLRSKLPVSKELLISKTHNAINDLKRRQEVQKKFYDKNSKDLKPLQSNDVIRVNHNGVWKSGMVIEKHEAPRSYVIKTEDGTVLRRNRRHLNLTGEGKPLCQPHVEEDWPSLETSSQPHVEDDWPSMETPSQPHVEEDWQSVETSSQPHVEEDWQVKKTRSGRVVKLPVRFKDNSKS